MAKEPAKDRYVIIANFDVGQDQNIIFQFFQDLDRRASIKSTILTISVNILQESQTLTACGGTGRTYA
jgi:hypothetical protein